MLLSKPATNYIHSQTLPSATPSSKSAVRSFGPTTRSNVPEPFGISSSPLTNHGLAEPTGESFLSNKIADTFWI